MPLSITAMPIPVPSQPLCQAMEALLNAPAESTVAEIIRSREMKLTLGSMETATTWSGGSDTAVPPIKARLV